MLINRIIAKLEAGEPLTKGERMQIASWLNNYKHLSIVTNNGIWFCYDGAGDDDDEEEEISYE